MTADRFASLRAALQTCQARKARGMPSVILSFGSWRQAKAFFPPGLPLGNLPNTDNYLVLFDVQEVISALQCILEMGPCCTRHISGSGGGQSG